MLCFGGGGLTTRVNIEGTMENDASGCGDGAVRAPHSAGSVDKRQEKRTARL